MNLPRLPEQRPLEAELHALVDNRLAPRRAAEVAAWLAENPEEAARVHDWRAQKEALHGAFDKLLEQPVPDRLRQAAQRRAMPRLAAAVAWLSLGLLVGFFAHDLPDQTDKSALAASLPRQAAIAHALYSPEVRHPVEVEATQEAHLVQWLSKRLGHELAIPRLGAQGFELVGGRLLPDEAGPAAQFMYQNAQGLRLTLYVRVASASGGETAFRYASEGSVGVFYWLDGPFGYALSGEMPRARLLGVAEAVYRELNR